MKSENSKISSTQLTFLIFSFIQCGILPLAYPSSITKNDTWLAVIISIFISIFFVLIYIKLSLRFPEKSLIQIHDIIYGRYLGKVFSILYLIFFISVIAANLWFIGSFWTDYLMPETPRAVFIIMFIFICSWAVHKGIEVISRCSFITSFVITFITVITAVLLFKNMKFTNFLPVLRTPVMNFVQSIHILVVIPFCEMIVFLMIFPMTNKIKQIKKATFTAVFLGGLFLLFIILRDTAVIGNLMSISTSPNFVSIRQINIGDILTRLDILVATGLMLAVFIKINVFLYAIISGVNQLVNSRSYKIFITPISILCIILGLIIFKSDMEQVYYGTNIWPFYTIPFELVFPIVTLIIAKFRGLPKKNGG